MVHSILWCRLQTKAEIFLSVWMIRSMEWFWDQKDLLIKSAAPTLPQVPHREIPQQKSMFKEFNPVSFLDKAAKILNCDIRRLRQSSRISSSDKADRDILVCALWKMGILTNEKIGQLFGVTPSSISHSVRALSLKLKKDRQSRDKSNQIYSLFKIWHLYHQNFEIL